MKELQKNKRLYMTAVFKLFENNKIKSYIFFWAFLSKHKNAIKIRAFVVLICGIRAVKTEFEYFRYPRRYRNGYIRYIIQRSFTANNNNRFCNSKNNFTQNSIKIFHVIRSRGNNLGRNNLLNVPLHIVWRKYQIRLDGNNWRTVWSFILGKWECTMHLLTH